MFDESLVTGNIDDTKNCFVVYVKGGKSELDGYPTRLFFLEPVGVPAGQATDQFRLAVIDVPGSPKYETSRCHITYSDTRWISTPRPLSFSSIAS